MDEFIAIDFETANPKRVSLKILVKHFGLPSFKHHDAAEDAIACANVFLKLQEHGMEKALQPLGDETAEFKGLVMGILADDEVNYKEAYELLYWLEDHHEIAEQHKKTFLKTNEVLEDDYLDEVEAIEMKNLLRKVYKTL